MREDHPALLLHGEVQGRLGALGPLEDADVLGVTLLTSADDEGALSAWLRVCVRDARTAVADDRRRVRCCRRIMTALGVAR